MESKVSRDLLKMHSELILKAAELGLIIEDEELFGDGRAQIEAQIREAEVWIKSREGKIPRDSKR